MADNEPVAEPTEPPTETQPAATGEPATNVVSISGGRAVSTTAEAEERPNAFEAVRQLLEAVRESMESSKREGQAPRWIRMVRVREFQGEQDYIAKGVREGLNGFAMGVGYMVELALDAKEILFQADAAKALVEVGAEFIKTASTDEFYGAITSAISGQPTGGTSPLKGVGPVIDTVVDLADRVPSPEDIDIIGNELYRLLCVEQLPLPRTTAGAIDESKIGPTAKLHVDVGASGKLRLMQWGLGRPIKTRGLGADESGEVDVTYLGSRRVWQAAAAKLPQEAGAIWGKDPDSFPLYAANFTDTGAGADIAEANALLTALGYPDAPAGDAAKLFDPNFAKRLRRFQHFNGLEINGELDNATINQLMHLDFATKNLRRAKPFDAAAPLPEDIDA